ncbi:ADP-ribose glycohydrolase MACROD2 isoform X3 [Alosa alosa]|uniref:ADP-ribose glycohydrolase MACROD2 isoform X3 n=1 Tax=Alosa alosa TaxID=278164 RepID=UPI0020150BF3|nr:ADP-ribose glycohydrolase MACROD2 isoform X3 [Alosa alosa]
MLQRLLYFDSFSGETPHPGAVSLSLELPNTLAVSLGLLHSKNSHFKPIHHGTMSKKKKDWRTEKERLLKLGLEERRKEYRGNFMSLDKVPTWRKHEKTAGKGEDEEQRAPSVSLSDKVSLHKGDITILEVDAIVNAANSSLLGGGGVDGCIHRAAGPCLYEECHTLNGCTTGKAKITGGYDLPAKYVIHTVGPIARGHVGSSQRDDLEACYKSSLQLVKENGLHSVAFPCISTGIYGFPNEPAAEIALKTVRSWIRRNRDEVDRVIFCVFLETDYKIYKEKMAEFFSQDNDMDEDGSDTQGDDDDDDGAAPADADMISQKVEDEEDEEEDEEQVENKEENRDVEMASQNLDEDEAALKDPGELSVEMKKDRDKEKNTTTGTASEDPAGEARGSAGAAKSKSEGEKQEQKSEEQEEEEEEKEKEEEKEEERGGAGEPAAVERECSSEKPEKKSPGVPEDKLGKDSPKVRAPLAEQEEDVGTDIDMEGDGEDAEPGDPPTPKDSDTSTAEDEASEKKKEPPRKE